MPQDGPISDLLWSDPEEVDNFEPSNRGAGFYFGKNQTIEFNYKNGIELVCRAHQMVEEGYLWGQENNVLTVFSAPNYCYRCGNLAGVVEVDELMNKTVISFEAAPKRGDFSSTRSIHDYFL